MSILAILSIFSTAAAAVGDDSSWNLNNVTLLCALGLISRIWTDLQARRQADESPTILTRVTRRRDAGNRGDLPAA